MPRKIHLWLPSFASGKGGIQVFSDYLLQALEEVSQNSRISVLIKNDTRAELESLPPRPSSTRLSTCGDKDGGLRTVSFSVKAFSMALRERPDLIITAHANFAPLARWVNRLLNVPYWTVCHGVEVWGLSLGLKLDSLRHSARLLCVSNYTMQQVALSPGTKFSPTSLTWFPNTIQTENFRIKPKPQYLLDRYGLRAETPVMFTLARMAAAEGYKGYDTIIKALPQIRDAVPDVRYLLGGKGDDRTRIEQLIRELGVEQNVIFTGFLPDNEVADHYQLCDLFAMPSKGEGFGIVFLEAIACGKPVLAGNKDGSVDAVNNGELGALVDPDNINEVAATAIQILQGTHPNKLLYKPEQLHRRVDEIYGFAQFKNRLEKLLCAV